ncbi:hypothetical protein [Cognatazoarcus halotolerans]|uniref:hypothetical protein n=1 Tax=Cognatazoarcus halotolerans TaxID=2686016 RepID=UPI001357F088|nr:hypothetical protein [Cognatazoarcus halotolerans]MCB1902290.1 hypothetical protein [Rhodocyclaceae bacterium]MCP5310220.1 hypothetical protein [Zoogloeaceae bacterium]
MTWLQLLAYFAVCTVALMAVLEAFAWLLRRVALLPRPLPLLLGLLLYGVVACAFALPLFGLELVQGPSASSSEAMRSVGLVGYLVCLLLAVLFFRRRHLDTLQALGYFRPRSRH